MKKRILIVEDDQSTMTIYKKSLKKDNWFCTFCSDLDKALDYLNGQQYDIIISDGNTGSSITGEEFLIRAATIQPDSLRILISGTIVPRNCVEIHLFIQKCEFSGESLKKMIMAI